MVENSSKKYNQLYVKWMFLRNSETFLSEHPKLQGKTIAIYGMGNLGNILLGEFGLQNRDVKYVVDQNWQCVFADCEMFTVEENLEPVDIMIITPICEYENIVDKLRSKVDCEFISIEVLVNDLWTEKMKFFEKNAL